VNQSNDFDVAVVGSGAAGLSAACEAAGLGARVLIAEATDIIGGSSRFSGGMIMAAGTSIQAKRGIEDAPDDLYRDYLEFNSWGVKPGLARQLAYGAGEAVEWLEKLGVEFARGVMIGGEERVPRSHVPRQAGQSIVDVLARECRARGVEFALGRRVDRLLVDEDTRQHVIGIAVRDDELRAGAVVVASGGFGANIEKLRRFLPSAVSDETWTWYIGSEGAQGDAIDLGEDVGAEICGVGRGLVLLTPNFVRELESNLPGWLLITDTNGERFCNETLSTGILQRLVEERGGRVFAIFDEAARLAARPDRHGEYRGRLPGGRPWQQSPNFNSITIEEKAGSGTIARDATIEGLAKLVGVHPEVLRATIWRYNQLVAGERDSDYGKESRFLRSIASPPYYGVELRLGTVALTASGLRIDEESRVLGAGGRIIPGLFAAGECVGGVIGDRYMGNGNSLANCLSFGRIAGRSAGEHSGVGTGSPSDTF
jgi:succinate dehydrogenase/fumarate reductase flavoprotein subunit